MPKLPANDKVTNYLKTILKGLVNDENKSEVSVKKIDENPETRVIRYGFYVPEEGTEDLSFFAKKSFRSGLTTMTRRAFYEFYPEYREEKWMVSLKKLDAPA